MTSLPSTRSLNPKAILDQIGSSHIVRDGQLESPGMSTAPVQPDVDQHEANQVTEATETDGSVLSIVESTTSATTSPAPADSVPKLRIVRHDVESYSDRLDEYEQPSLQVSEIAGHLRHRKEQLDRRESDLRKQINIWQSQVDSQIALSAWREKSLRERESQIKSLQFELLQLQNDVIDSQLAMEQIVEQFANDDIDGKMLVALEMLRFEIRERFDYVAERWDRLHAKLDKTSTRRAKRCA